MDRKLFLTYIQNMQQNNPDMIGFQNSLTKNSWQKPKSLYEMNGGGHVFQGDFDREDAARQPARDADEAGLRAILNRPKGEDGKPLMDKDGKPVLSDVEDLAAKAHQEFVDNDGTGHHGIGEAEASDILRDHPTWRSLSNSARKYAIATLISHVDKIHDSYVESTIAQHGPDEDEEEMKVNALHQQGKFLPKMP